MKLQENMITQGISARTLLGLALVSIPLMTSSCGFVGDSSLDGDQGFAADFMSTPKQMTEMIKASPLVDGPFSEDAVRICESWGVENGCRDSQWGSAFIDEIRSYMDAQEEDELALTPVEPIQSQTGAENATDSGNSDDSSTSAEEYGFLPSVFSLSLAGARTCRPNDPAHFAYGPFTQRAIAVCKSAGGGRACTSNCWDRGFFNKVAAKVRANSSSSSQYTPTNSSLGSRFASTVRSMAIGFTGRCWKWVNDAIVRVTGVNIRMGSHAKAFLNTARANPAYVKRNFGLCLSSNRSSASAPIGSVMIYAPGYCGFNRLWGHGEIKVGQSSYCSDGCMNTAARCPYPTAIMVPCGTR